MSASFYTLIIFLFAALCNTPNPEPKDEAPEPDDVREKVLVQNLENIWEMIWGPDGKIWITERGGKISRVEPATGAVTRVLEITDVKSRGEGGLLGMAFHPDFPQVPQLFVEYDYESANGYKGKVVRFNWTGTTLTEPKVILDNINAAGIHNGSRLFFSPDKKLFITTGDASTQRNAQERNSVNGKILRINIDGSVPADNPFPNNPVWSYGHRNPQGLVFVKGKLYESEHGPSNDDEINIIVKGRNYGWPEVTGFCDERSEQKFCTEYNVVQPLKSWTPTLAVSGLDYYGKTSIASWTNSLLLVTLKDNTLYQLKLNEAGDKIVDQNEYLRGKYGRLRDVCVAPDGKVYVCTSNGGSDKIIVLSAR